MSSDAIDYIKNATDRIKNIKADYTQNALLLKELSCSSVEGMKFDKDKLRYDLIPPEVKKWLAEVLTYGAKKYAPDNWKKIEVERYYAAMERHMVAYQLGEEKDPESGIHHLIHMMCNAMFICWLEHYKKD